MYKSTALALLIISSNSFAAIEDFVGNWKCKFESDYINADENLTINKDQTYKKIVRLSFGPTMADTGNWSLEKQQMVLHRLEHDNGKEKSKSDHEFKFTVSKLDKNNLVYNTGKATTTCTK
jgi:hypothetical protein